MFDALLANPSVAALFSTLGATNVRLVGGCVRDTLAGLPVHDLDACTKLRPDEVMARVNDTKTFVAHPTGIDHGTVTLVHQESRQTIELTTLRQDIQTDGRHAQIAYDLSWEADAARRDFTFNALMLDHEGRIYDFFEGQADLCAGRVRFIGRPLDRLAEDWLRALRYLRFWGRFGRVRPTFEERAALETAGDNLVHLSVERIWLELKRLVQTPGAQGALALFDELGFSNTLDLTLTPACLSGLDPVAAWASVLIDGGADFPKRMHASRAEQTHFASVQGALRSEGTLFARQVKFGTKATAAAEIAQGRSGDLPPISTFPVTAKHLLELGYEEGPELGQTLAKLKDLWIQSEGEFSTDDFLAELTKSQT